jgi:RNA polymerase sigma-70 factor, ECF subfamily
MIVRKQPGASRDFPPGWRIVPSEVSIATSSVDPAAMGGQQAFMELIEPELPGAYRLAVGMLRNQVEAEDAVQEAALNAWRGFARFRRDAQVRPWFSTIVANECRSRQRSRWWSVIRGWTVQPAPLPEDDPATPDLRTAIARLPHKMRLALVLRYYLDLSFEEAARTMGVSTKAAKSRTYRALERLRLSPEVLPDE